MAKPKLSTKHMMSIYGGAAEREHASASSMVEQMVSEAGPRLVVNRDAAYLEERKRMEKWLAGHVEKGRHSFDGTLTPVLAELLLERNPRNRKIASANLMWLEREISEGRYKDNGEATIIMKDGTLGDGQHRCEAVVRTGTAVPTTFSFGIAEDARETIDIGTVRTAANILTINHEVAEPNTAATVAGMIYKWRNHNRISRDTASLPSKTEIVQTYRAYERRDGGNSIDESIEFCSRKRAKKVTPKAILAFCHWAFTEAASRAAADAFMRRLIDGDRPSDGDPVLYCRDRLMAMKKWVFPQIRVNLIFKAWNAYRREEKVTFLKADKDSLSPLEG